MNRQMSFSKSEFSSKKRVTRKEVFLALMEQVMPWKRLVERLEPHCPKGDRGRPPKGLERMLRLLVEQNCFGLSDEGLEDAVYEIQSIRHFVGVDLGNSESTPAATTVLKFHRFLEEHNLTRAILEEVNASLAEGPLKEAVQACEKAKTWVGRLRLAYKRDIPCHGSAFLRHATPVCSQNVKPRCRKERSTCTIKYFPRI